MADVREEAEFHAENARLLTAFHEAKANKDADPEAWQAAKYAYDAFRSYWRGIRRYNQDLAMAGDAEAMAAFVADVGAGGAVVAPAPVDMTTATEG